MKTVEKVVKNETVTDSRFVSADVEKDSVGQVAGYTAAAAE